MVTVKTVFFFGKFTILVFYLSMFYSRPSVIRQGNGQQFEVKVIVFCFCFSFLRLLSVLQALKIQLKFTLSLVFEQSAH